jgi:hypothetical protein
MGVLNELDHGNHFILLDRGSAAQVFCRFSRKDEEAFPEADQASGCEEIDRFPA